MFELVPKYFVILLPKELFWELGQIKRVFLVQSRGFEETLFWQHSAYKINIHSATFNTAVMYFYNHIKTFLVHFKIMISFLCHELINVDVIAVCDIFVCLDPKRHQFSLSCFKLKKIWQHLFFIYIYKTDVQMSPTLTDVCGIILSVGHIDFGFYICVYTDKKKPVQGGIYSRCKNQPMWKSLQPVKKVRPSDRQCPVP